MKRKLATAAALFGVGLLSSRAASAFCRTTTCDPTDPAAQCELDADNCVLSGKPLYWPSSCVTVGVQQLGSPKSGLSFDDVAPVVEQAFGAWMQADCGKAGPSIDVQMIGPIECDASEYNSNAGNANVVLFREDDWPYVGASNAVGLTTTRFDTQTGELWDADIELNAATVKLSVGDPIEGYDLLSVLTHEGGHFLGLAHSSDPTATMKYSYDPQTDGDAFRSLAQDDVDGICSIYPPDRKAKTNSCVNRHGFSSQCGADQPPQPTPSGGCSLNARAAFGATGAGWGAVLLGLCGLRLARRRRIV